MAGIRSFVAVELSPEIKDGITEIQERLRSSGADVRWVRPEGIHLTLKFLGDIEEEDIDNIAGCLKSAANGLNPFAVEIKEVGAFPNLRNPRTLWVGVTENRTLSSLQNEVEKALEGIGFPRENRPFRPHLTLGRVKSPKLKVKLIEALEKERAQEIFSPRQMSVEELTLFQSDLRPGGAVYTKLKTVKL
ncbi:MAG: RNA 2',3'-cyclic phosphodiesterase [Deltaproteobacteria bacterium]|nr:MAG: RNA 2',3'-cyclic phosphodiesterase [Deltaproteobacteria bacterium]